MLLREGSELAYLVKDPLPLNFKIIAESITRVMPEVLYVGTYTPVSSDMPVSGCRSSNPSFLDSMH